MQYLQQQMRALEQAVTEGTLAVIKLADEYKGREALVHATGHAASTITELASLAQATGKSIADLALQLTTVKDKLDQCYSQLGELIVSVDAPRAVASTLYEALPVLGTAARRRRTERQRGVLGEAMEILTAVCKDLPTALPPLATLKLLNVQPWSQAGSRLVACVPIPPLS